MIKGIQNCGQITFKFLEKGLNHPNFFGRMITWGVFWGILGFLSSRVYQYSLTRFQNKKTDEEPSKKEVEKETKPIAKKKVVVIEAEKSKKKEASKKKRPTEIQTQKKIAPEKELPSPKTEVREKDDSPKNTSEVEKEEDENSSEKVKEKVPTENTSEQDSSTNTASEQTSEIIDPDKGNSEKKEKVDDKPKKKNRPWPFG
jgi:hypothetical protein